MKLDDFEIPGNLVDIEFHECSDFLPSERAGRSGIDVEQAERLVVDHAQNMAVAGYHQRYSVFDERTPHSGTVVPRIASYVAEPHSHALAVEDLALIDAAAHHCVVDIAADGSDRRYLGEAFDDGVVADVAGVPDFPAVGEVSGIAVVPIGVGVAQDSYSFQFSSIRISRGAKVISGSMVTVFPVSMSRRSDP